MVNTIKRLILKLDQRDMALWMPWTPMNGGHQDVFTPHDLDDAILQVYLDDPDMPDFEERMVSCVRSNSRRNIVGIWFVNGITDVWLSNEAGWTRKRYGCHWKDFEPARILVTPLSDAELRKR